MRRKIYIFTFFYLLREKSLASETFVPINFFEEWRMIEIMFWNWCILVLILIVYYFSVNIFWLIFNYYIYLYFQTYLFNFFSERVVSSSITVKNNSPDTLYVFFFSITKDSLLVRDKLRVIGPSNSTNMNSMYWFF